MSNPRLLYIDASTVKTAEYREWLAQKGCLVTHLVEQEALYKEEILSNFDLVVLDIRQPTRAKEAILNHLAMLSDRPPIVLLVDEDPASIRAISAILPVEQIIANQNVRLVQELLWHAVETAYTKDQQLQILIRHNANLDAFADSVAHDLKNPITHFLSYADDLSENLHVMQPQEIKSYLDIIVQQSRKMSEIIDALLLFARVRTIDDIEIQVLDMGQIVNESIARLQPEIDAKNAQIELPSTWPSVYGYAPWVESMWTNYINNGLKYGGDPPRLIIGTEEEGNGMARFWVRDHGCGFREDEQKKLFHPFPMLRRPGDRSYGLGLVIVRRIAERLNGYVSIESEPNKGSVFSFSLPTANE